jgi:hypothetical protein
MICAPTRTRCTSSPRTESRVGARRARTPRAWATRERVRAFRTVAHVATTVWPPAGPALPEVLGGCAASAVPSTASSATGGGNATQGAPPARHTARFGRLLQQPMRAGCGEAEAACGAGRTFHINASVTLAHQLARLPEGGRGPRGTGTSGTPTSRPAAGRSCGAPWTPPVGCTVGALRSQDAGGLATGTRGAAAGGGSDPLPARACGVGGRRGPVRGAVDREDRGHLRGSAGAREA